MNGAVTWRLSDDRKQMIADIPGGKPAAIAFDAGAADQMIRTVTGLRMHMEPEIPMRDPEAGQSMPVLPRGRWWVQPDLMSGGIVLALLHPGCGWVGLQMEQKESSHLIQRILQQRPSAAPSAKEPSN